MMIRRHSKRFNVFIDGDLKTDDARHTGFIGNISDRGLYMRLSSVDTSVKLAPGMIVTIETRLQCAEVTSICSRLVWVSEALIGKSISKAAYKIGMEIVGPHQQYNDYYNKLAINGLRDYIESFGFDFISD